ncbi:hypothetical protein COB57_05030 [Candidatus Peregrinibacteria bacterium]|nr:MAG: hypothetical protein COB57_05030 [Candidatus Peregrinibacteria bacterium]
MELLKKLSTLQLDLCYNDLRADQIKVLLCGKYQDGAYSDFFNHEKTDESFFKDTNGGLFRYFLKDALLNDIPGICCGMLQKGWFNNVHDFLEYYYEVNSFVLHNYQLLFDKGDLVIDIFGSDRIFMSYAEDKKDFLHQVNEAKGLDLLYEIFYRNMSFIYDEDITNSLRGDWRLYPSEDYDACIYEQNDYSHIEAMEESQGENTFTDIFIDIYLRKTGRWKYWKKKMNQETGPFRKWERGDEEIYLGGWRDICYHQFKVK